ncbi:hypothetical protein NECAME_17938, partial [Necator americanus]
MRKRQCICGGISGGLFLVGAGLVTAGLVVVLKVFPDIVNKTVTSQKVLGLNSDGTLNDFTKSWATPSYISTMQYWAFDYKNSIGILNRAIYPDMDEKGPYSYDLHGYCTTLSQLHLQFQTVDELLFTGYVSPLITKLADRVINIVNTLIGTKFPLVDPAPFTVALNTENGTTDTLYTVDSGKLDYSRAGYILYFNNMTNASIPSQGNKLPSQWWPGAETPSCNGYALTLEGTSKCKKCSIRAK